MQRAVTPGTDFTLSSYPLGAGCTLNNVHVEGHFMATQESDAADAVFYGLSGFIVPVTDPDSGVNVDVLWDNLIPKDLDQGAGLFDLDTGAADTTPEFEIGELDLSAIFDLVSLAPKEIFRRRKMVTAASNPTGYNVVSAGPDTWSPMDYFTSQVRKRFRSPTMSMILFGVSSPDTSQTTTTIPLIPTEPQWMMLRMLDRVLEDMLYFVAGLAVESTSTTPFDEASAFIANLVENDVFEGTGGSYVATTWNCFVNTTYDVTVPGKIAITSLSSE